MQSRELDPHSRLPLLFPHSTVTVHLKNFEGEVKLRGFALISTNDKAKEHFL